MCAQPELLGDRAEGGKRRDPGSGLHNIELALFPLHLFKGRIALAKIRHVYRNQAPSWRSEEWNVTGIGW
jgi:hypothetical protein